MSRYTAKRSSTNEKEQLSLLNSLDQAYASAVAIQSRWRGLLGRRKANAERQQMETRVSSFERVLLNVDVAVKSIRDLIAFEEQLQYASICKVCLRVLQEPRLQVPCGHVACSSCIERHAKCSECEGEPTGSVPHHGMANMLTLLPEYTTSLKTAIAELVSTKNELTADLQASPVGSKLILRIACGQ